METRADYVVVGGFVVAILGCLVVALLWFARVQFNQQASFYDIYFTGSVTGLNQGSAVRYNGIPIGRVAEIQLDPQDPRKVRVTIEVGANTPIKSDAVASLEMQGLTGGTFVEISGGSKAAAALERQDNQRYPVIASRPSGLQQVVTNAPEVLARFLSLADQISGILSPSNQAALAETLENVRRVTAAAAGHADQVGTVIDDGAGAMRELRATIATANRTVDELRGLMAPDGQLSTALKSVEDTSRKAGEVADHLDSLVQENRRPVRDFAQRGLDQMQQLIADTRNLVVELTRVAELLQRDPSRFLYGDQRQGYRPR